MTLSYHGFCGFLRHLPKRFYVYAAILLLLALSPFWSGPRPSQVRLHGTAQEMGEQYGRAYWLRLRLLSRVYLKGIVCGNRDDRVEKAKSRARECWPAIAPRYREEIEAVGHAAGVDPALILLGNSFVDLGYGGGACRTVVSQTAQGGLLHAHNLDWDNLAGLGNWCITIVRRAPSDGRRRTVSIGVPGMVGALDIVNDRGLALSVNQIGFGRHQPGEPTFLLLRRVAETCDTFAQARAELLQAAPDTPFLITLSSAQEGRAAVFEPQGNHITERELKDGLVAADNEVWGPGYDGGIVEKAVRAAAPRDLAAVQAVMAHPDVLLVCNLYSVVFDFRANRFYLASGRMPAATHGYREFPLF